MNVFVLALGVAYASFCVWLALRIRKRHDSRTVMLLTTIDSVVAYWAIGSLLCVMVPFIVAIVQAIFPPT